MFNQKDIFHLFIIKDIAATASAAQKIDAYTDLADGEAVLVNKGNYVMAPSGTYDPGTVGEGRIIARRGTNLITSPLIKKNNIRRWSGKLGTSAYQQLDYIGFNGTSGSMDYEDYTNYIVRILVKDTQTTFGNKQMWKFGAYKSGLNATQYDVAFNLCVNLNDNFRREPEKYIQFDVICNHAGTEVVGTNDTIYGYKGENTLVIAEIGNQDDVAVLGAGDFIRIGTAKTDPVYKIISGSTTAAAGGTLTLDRPLTSTKEVATGGTSTGHIEYITAAQAATVDFGIKCQGIARTNFQPGVFKYKIPSWSIQLNENFLTATVTNNTAASPGIGTYEQVAELEWFEYGNRGKIERVGVPPPSFTTYAVSGTTYDMFYLEYFNDEYKSTITAPTQQTQQIIIAIDNGYDNGESGDLLVEAIDDLYGTACGLAK